MTRPFITLSTAERDERVARIVSFAEEAGADQAALIPASEIVVDERVLMKCRLSCKVYGRCLTCPPRSPRPDETRAMLSRYSLGLVVRRTAPADQFCGEAASQSYEWSRVSLEIQELVVRAESYAFYQGFYLAMAFGCGRCRFCGLDGACKGLESGQCLHPYRARPSMEAMGIDVFATVHGLGWSISVIGKQSRPEQIEVAGYIGLVLIY